MLRHLGFLRVARFGLHPARSLSSSPALQQAKKKKDAGGPAVAAVETFDLKVQIPVNLLKGTDG